MIYKTCTCCEKEHTFNDISDVLKHPDYVGNQSGMLEMFNCECQSTLCVPIDPQLSL